MVLMSSQEMVESYGGAIGYVVDEATSSKVTVRTKEPLKVGEYVIIKPLNSNEEVLGWVEESIARNELLGDLADLENPHLAGTILRTLMFGQSNTKYFAIVKVLTKIKPLIKMGKQEPPRVAIDPGSEVYKASKEALVKIFSREGDKRFIKLGELAAHPGVGFYVDVTQIVSRHMAVVAVTGAGKSNTVTVLTTRIVKEKNGCVLIFDMHGEYSRLDAEYVNVIEPKLDPTKLDADSFSKLIGLSKDAHKQELYLRNVLTLWKVIENSNVVESKEKFFRILQNMLIELMHTKEMPVIHYDNIALAAQILREYGKFNPTTPLTSIKIALKNANKTKVCEKNDCSDLYTVIDAKSDVNSAIPNLLVKIQDAEQKYKEIFDFDASDVVERIKPASLNVMDLHSLDEDMADIIVSVSLKSILNARKRKVLGEAGSKGKAVLKVPILLVLEEAHILAPANRRTLTKYWVSRITREGRKFGVGLVMVSQRPKGLDQDALSQANNLIVLKLVEPGDQRHVQASSEGLSEELVKHLPSLSVGEALVLGPLAPLPAIVKVDHAEIKKVGQDIDAVDEWEKYHATRDDEEWGTWEE
ncbi:ATP-binding protein [Ignicoccus hospitalis]|uniref:Helicase HerA central domain-containing protein n=1 Tax=Ignicoccus hospitalis (strain KIN4/I / DSM 18386 / JCM 14125) TaxID=453591 RepID=A8AAG5_IGNH4|nr:ATP-binding protein [Ignicoccus hospitalis]ABU81917.1 protein of unknown function DUF87 [Ignicoccus hospitalis KIN4/I]HIH89925.1 ATP-binding protein [Desulfurococcaceae archaeon]